jgi:tRNA threonylcarbamoyladenosine biosynthesis protein TsaB
MAEDVLGALNLTFADVGLFAVAEGPGSFTGVSIGAALVKGLAFGRDIPCIGVSTLEALAENIAPLRGVLVPCMDARRAQVYTATFISDGKEIKRVTEDRAMAIADLATELKEYENERIYISGDGYLPARRVLDAAGVVTEITPELLINESAASVGRIAYRKYLGGERTSDAQLMPTYLRMPQAERERLERLNAEKSAEQMIKTSQP